MGKRGNKRGKGRNAKAGRPPPLPDTAQSASTHGQEQSALHTVADSPAKPSGADDTEYMTGEEDYVDSDFEGKDGYRKGGYHPVSIGDKFSNGRYVVLRKLGWGHFSTVWLTHDRHTDGLAALKIQKSATHYTEAARDEIDMLAEIRDNDPEDVKCCCRLLDTFDHVGPHGRHVCMVFEVLGDNLLALIKHFRYRGIPLDVVRNITRQVLVGLDYLHTKLEIIHTDLKPENVMLGLPLHPREWKLPALDACKHLMANAVASADAANKPLTKNQKKRLKKKFKKRLEAGTIVHPTPIMADGTPGEPAQPAASTALASSDIDAVPSAGAASSSVAGASQVRSASRPSSAGERSVAAAGSTPSARRPSVDSAATLMTPDSTGPLAERHFVSQHVTRDTMASASCKIVDFGNACWRSRHFTDDIQTRQYRSPEVIVGQGYDTSTDLWSLACMVFELVTGDLLFDPREAGDRSYSRDEDHLALMMELLGPMPVSMTLKGVHTSRFFEREGKHLKRIKQLKFWPLGHVLVEKYSMAPDEAAGLTAFLMRMLVFHPGQRATAADLLHDPWLTSTLPEPPADLVALASSKHTAPAPPAAPAAPVVTATATAPQPAAALAHIDDSLDPYIRRPLSAPPCLSGGDDAARAGAARGYSASFCADLSRYAITLADFAALEARDLAEAEADLRGGVALEDTAYAGDAVYDMNGATDATLQVLAPGATEEIAAMQQPVALAAEDVAEYMDILRAHKAQILEASLEGLDPASAAEVLGPGVLSSLQLGPDFATRLPSLNLHTTATGSPAASPPDGAGAPGSAAAVTENAAAAANGAAPAPADASPLAATPQQPATPRPADDASQAKVLAAGTGKALFAAESSPPSGLSEDTVGVGVC